MRAVRFPESPLIRPEMLPADEGANINGPSLIRAPDWVPRPLGRYYLYFAHHRGAYIRLAVADDLHGPWRIHHGGVLHVDDTPLRGHIASPDAHVLDEGREIRMYCHGGREGGGPQVSVVARSPDGVSFTSGEAVIGPAYMRAFRLRGAWHAVCMAGNLLRSADGLGPFEAGPQVFDFAPEGRKLRHTAVHLRGERLRVFFSRIGDAPEHIMYADILLRGEWEHWTAGEARSLLVPETDYEGAALPLEPSVMGLATQPVRQLRDPAIYEEDGRAYLLYSVAGESGIAAAELLDEPAPGGSDVSAREEESPPRAANCPAS